MIEEIIDFKNYVLKISTANSTNELAVLMLHGFPSESKNKTCEEKNRDLGFDIAKNIECSVFVHHYDGLGENTSGIFSFNRSIEDSIELAKMLLKSYKKLIIIGHSWGGFVAMNCFAQLHQNIPKMILLSPLSDIPKKEILNNVIKELVQPYPYLLKNRTILEYVNELSDLKDSKSPFNVLNNLKHQSKILVLQAKLDDEVSIESTSRLLKAISGDVRLEILNDDHSFSNRDNLFKMCIEEIRSYV